MIASQLLAPALLGHRQQGPWEPDNHLGPVGHCPPRSTLLIAIIDDSGSVTSPGGTDPVAQRYAEMVSAFATVAKACDCGQERAAILHFDTPHGDSGPHRLTTRGLRRLRSGLTAPQGTSGSSSLLPALRKATALARQHPNGDIVLMIFSDFCLTDPEPSHVLNAMEGFPGLVYACLLGGDGVPCIPGADLTIHVGDHLRSGYVARALMAGLTVHRLPHSISTTGPQQPVITSATPNN